jgi:high-affinity Fe2+/Pb2+ permease
MLNLPVSDYYYFLSIAQEMQNYIFQYDAVKVAQDYFQEHFALNHSKS